MTREFKVGDRVVGTQHAYAHRRGRKGTVSLLEGDYVWVSWDSEAVYGGATMAYHSDLRHAEPVPLGYTGKLRDMDLQEGDVVQVVGGKSWAVTGVDDDGMVMINDPPATRLSSALDFTLISRANRAHTTPPDQWSDWQLSRKDGYMAQQYAEVQTVPLDDTQQVVYRGRGKPVHREVMTVSVAIVDGKPDWGTVEDVVL